MLTRPWEKLVSSQKYNEVRRASLLCGADHSKKVPSQLGAVRFDRDLRAVTTYLFSQTAFGDARDKFVRLQQISTLLNLDQVGVPCVLFRQGRAKKYIRESRKRTWMSFITVLGSPGS